MSNFADNRTFTCIDTVKHIRMLLKSQNVLQQIVKLYEQGHIHPTRPITLFNATDMEDAYRYMQQFQNVGKIVIKLPEQDTLPPTLGVPEPIVKGDASYVLVGGTGGLGKVIAIWMASYGTQNLILVSRSARQSADDQDFPGEFREGGCEVQCFAGDMADPELICIVIKETHLPIIGVLQMAMVLQDASIMNMDVAKWAAATRPKIDGTWNLHRLLPRGLDFFILVSSTSRLIGYFGQANYASVNTFLDAFVQYRQGHGQVHDGYFIAGYPRVMLSCAIPWRVMLNAAL